MWTKTTPEAHQVGEYDPFEDSEDSDSTDSDSSGTESLQEYSISSATSAEPLLPEDDPMDGTTTYPRPGEDADPGFSLQTSKDVESHSVEEGVSKEIVACHSVSTKAEKETDDKDKNDKATDKSTDLEECEGSGRNLGPPENQRDVCTSSSVSDIKGRAQQIVKIHPSNTPSVDIAKTGCAAGGGSTVSTNSNLSLLYGQKQMMNEESESGAYNPNFDSSASSSSSSPDTSEIRKPYISVGGSAQSQLLETRSMLEENSVVSVGGRSVPFVEENVVQNPEMQTKCNEESNKNYAGVSCADLKTKENSDMNRTAGPEDDVFKVSKFRQKLGRTATDFPSCASDLSESYAPISENTSISHQLQATATVKEAASMEENAQFAEVTKGEGEPYIAQQRQSYEVWQSVQQPWNPPLVKKSSWAVPSCETVKATVEKTTGLEDNRVSKFQAKLSEIKKRGEFPAASKKVSIVTSVLAQNVQAPLKFPTSSSYSTRQTESNIEKNILEPDQGALSHHFAPTLLSESQTLSRPFRPPVDQILYLRAENSMKTDVMPPLHPETNVLDEPQAHGKATVETKLGPEHASNIFDTGVKQRLKGLKLQKICEDDFKVLIEYCNGWFEAKSNLGIEQIPRESVDNADRAFKIFKGYVDSVEAVFNQYTFLPQGQFSQYVTPLRHGIMKNAPSVFREIIANRVEEFATEYEKRNAEIFRQEEEVIRALIGTAGDYFEEEAAFVMKSDYFEAQPLSILLSPIEEQAKQSFLHACDSKFPTWQRKYSEMFDVEILRRKQKIQSDNERQRLKTQKEIDEVVIRLVSEYTQDIQGRLKNLPILRFSQREKFQQAHQTIKENMIKKLDAEFLKKWFSCPGLHDTAKKNLGTKIEEVRNKEYESLVTQEAKQKGTAHYNSTTTTSSTYSEKGSCLEDHNLRGITNAKGASKPPAFTELPSRTVAIHMGLSCTRVVVIRPGTKEFQNIAEVDNCLYYRDGSILLAYSDPDKQKLNPQDVNFQGGLVEGPIDQLHEVTLNGERLQLRKEHIISSILAVLKCKAELELQAKCQHCVIVVPQFLNETQRTCIWDAALIADFNGIKIIDDTVAIALEYMMRKQERDRYLIVTCAMEGVVDVAKFHIKDGLLHRLEVSGTHFLRNDQAKEAGWGLGGFLSFFTWSREEKENIVKKIFSNKELNLGQYSLEQMLKLFAGDTEMLNSIKTVLKEATNLEQVSELNAIAGGAMFAALCEERQNCPLYSAWKSMRSRFWACTFEDFKTKILSVSEKEKKRSSNPSEGMVMTVEAVHVGKREGHLRSLKEVHSVALEAVKIIRSLQIAVSRKEAQDTSSSELLLQELAKHKRTLQQANLRLQEAKQVHDELLNIWYEKVLGWATF